LVQVSAVNESVAWGVSAAGVVQQIESDFGPNCLRGDCNADTRIDMSDVICGLSLSFTAKGSAPGCTAVLDVNGDASVDPSDPVSLPNYLFAAAPPPASPFPTCGPSDLETDTALGCEIQGCPSSPLSTQIPIPLRLELFLTPCVVRNRSPILAQD